MKRPDTARMLQSDQLWLNVDAYAVMIKAAATQFRLLLRTATFVMTTHGMYFAFVKTSLSEGNWLRVPLDPQLRQLDMRLDIILKECILVFCILFCVRPASIQSVSSVNLQQAGKTSRNVCAVSSWSSKMKDLVERSVRRSQLSVESRKNSSSSRDLLPRTGTRLLPAQSDQTQQILLSLYC